MTESPTRLRRALPMLALAGVSFAVGAIVGGGHSVPASHKLASQFVAAWARGDYPAMYSYLDTSSQRAIRPAAFAAAYRQALTTATATSVQLAGKPSGRGEGIVAVPALARTNLFGTLRLSFMLKIVRGKSGEGERVAWSRSMLFPGLFAGEQLTRATTLPRRAAVLARDGSVLAEGSPRVLAGEQTRSSPLGEVASAVLGAVGPIPAARRRSLEAQGVPADATVGLTGLELALDDRLRGTPGGQLLAESPQAGGTRRVLASAVSRPAPAFRSSVSPSIQRAAVIALGGQLGGIVAMDPSSGRIVAVAGIGLDGLQPPGSTFKMITLSGALEAGIANPHTVFPYASYATLDGVRLNNANGENCGGTLELAFAVSCNSVFTPLGVKLGATRLVSMAERFGFNHDTGLPGAAQSTLPAAPAIQGELAVGSTAIGQGQVLATPLQMATVAATIADGGRRPTPTFEDGTHAAAVPAIMATVARTVRRLMIAVVRAGTGTSAAIPGVTVAGKTGTAELKTECSSTGSETASREENGSASGAEGCGSSSHQASNTDAWFAAFAPALRPRIVVAVLLVKDGAGGETAAPVARQVLEAGLQARAH
ncbi:MAG TPA: penicillin-binding transpeptidase domain-containing protein [Solirubrobacteraceae bacterium]|nr:penicillin-binding transpeptidase domain-containing protein [Solirubrobacteraceae bacterium]